MHVLAPTHNTSDREKSMLLRLSSPRTHKAWCVCVCVCVLGGGGLERREVGLCFVRFWGFSAAPELWRVCSEGTKLISLLSSGSRAARLLHRSSPHHCLSSTRQRLVARSTSSSSSTTLNPFRSSFPRHPS